MLSYAIGFANNAIRQLLQAKKKTMQAPVSQNQVLQATHN